jgi:hypothetical protein
MVARAPRLLPPRDLLAVDQSGRFTEVWYEYFQGGVSADRIFGTTTNDSATTGYLGEMLTAGPTEQNLTTGTSVNVTSKLITPGDWDLFAPIHFQGQAATETTEVLASISTVSATLDDTIGQHAHWRGPAHTDAHFTFLLGPVRVSLATSTTYYLVAEAEFTVSTYKAAGSLYARRAR